MEFDLNKMSNEVNVKRSKRISNLPTNRYNKDWAIITPSLSKKEVKPLSDKFKESSLIERMKMDDFLKSKGITDYGFTPIDSFERYDGWYRTKNGKKYIFEVKVRNVESTKYETTLIEKSKYDYLYSSVFLTQVGCLVFIFFTDGKVLIEDILTVEPTFIEMSAPLTTQGYRGRVNKTFLEIPINLSNLHNEQERPN